MSWIVAILLAIYGLVRIVLRVRGELLYRRASLMTGAPRPKLNAPPELGPPFAALFDATKSLSGTLHEATQLLERIIMTDPDAPLGEIRDERYRRQVLESWNALRRWRQDYDGLDDSQIAYLEQHGEDGRPLVSAMEHLRDAVRRARRSRPLEAFPIDEVRAVFDQLRFSLRHSDRLCEGLITAARDPYRGVVTKKLGVTPP